MLIGLSTVLLVGWLVDMIKPMSTPSPAPRKKPQWQMVGFYENQTRGDPHPGSWQTMVHHSSQLTMGSPLWYAVDRNGTVINTGYDARVVRYAHAHHLAVDPLFVNAMGRTGVLWHHSTRHRAVRQIAQVVQQEHLDGVNIDFELLNPTSRDDLSRFIADLPHTLHALHKTVSVSVFPEVSVPHAINGAYDYAALGRSADYLVLMAYDHHFSGGPPGMVAPYWWVSANVSTALKRVPARHIILAIGLYGYDWVNHGSPGRATTVSDSQAKGLSRRYGVAIHYSSSESQNFFTYKANGVSHIVYFMGDRSARARIALAQSRHLGGVALWRLGYQDTAFWQKAP